MAHIDDYKFDWLNPDYAKIWGERAYKLAAIGSDPIKFEYVKAYYRYHIADFINDWGVTVDPRNVGTSRPVLMPFVLFHRQREWIDTVFQHCMNDQDLITVKSRDCGISWLAMAFSVSMCLLWDGMAIGFGSATEIKVDRSGDPDSLFYKGRMFVEHLPKIWKKGFTLKHHSAHMRLIFDTTGSSITGEAGDNIGRGGRKKVYFVDECAHLEHPRLVDAALSANTNCRIEMSSVNGTANTFAERARGGAIDRFDFHYRDDPRKMDQEGAMYPAFEKKKKSTDPIVWNQEYELNFLASVEGIIIPNEWVQAAIGAHKKLGITPSGEKRGSYDVADRGIDKNAYVSSHGILIRHLEIWSGQSSDIYESTEQCFRLAESLDDDGFEYDADGLGAAVRGDSRKINEDRVNRGKAFMRVDQFRGSAGVEEPEAIVEGTDRTNLDFFENHKAQAWWGLRQRFLNTFRAVNGEPFEPDAIISLDPGLKHLTQLCMELSQPVWTWSKSGKMMVDKTPDDVSSPNAADAVMMRLGYRRRAMRIDQSVINLFQR